MSVPLLCPFNYIVLRCPIFCPLNWKYCTSGEKVIWYIYTEITTTIGVSALTKSKGFFVDIHQIRTKKSIVEDAQDHILTPTGAEKKTRIQRTEISWGLYKA